MAAINFALLFLSITTSLYPPKDIIFKETATRTEDLGFYASTNIQLLPTIDLTLFNLINKGRGLTKYQNDEPKYTKGRTLFTLLNLLTCGDISSNPGPSKHPCGTCSKSVRSNPRATMCDQCNLWFHTKYMNISISSYNNLSQSNDEWFCLNCSLPKFSDSFFEENVSIDVADLPQNTDLSDTRNPVPRAK